MNSRLILSLLGATLIVLKLLGKIELSWFWTLTPFLVISVMWVFGVAIVLVASILATLKKD